MKYALVTGGSRGIGRAICLSLSRMGYHVLINYLNNDTEAHTTLQMIREAGNSASLLKFDVASVSETEQILENWQNEHPEDYIEVLVNNAGIRKDALLMWMKNEEWYDVLRTNLDSFFYISRKLIKNMLVKRKGRIINIVSLSGIKGLPGQVNYSAAKAAVIGATKALAQEVGKKNVTVNAVAPGYIRTDMTADLDEKSLKAMIPMDRFGKPEEVSELVAFLAGENASYITGEVISVNGGLYT